MDPKNDCQEEQPFSFPMSLLAIMFTMNILGIANNYISVRRIANNFDTGRIIFRLLQIDALLSLTGCIGSLVVAVTLYFTNGIIVCTLNHVTSICPVLFGLLISVLLSVMRYVNLKHGFKDALALESYFTAAAYVTLGTFSIGVVIFYGLHLTVVRPFKFIGFCMYGACAEPSHPASSIIIISYNLIMCLISLFFAALTAMCVRNKVAAITKNKAVKAKNYTVPTRATALAAAVTVAMGIMLAVVQKMTVPTEQTLLAPYALGYLVNAFRCPLATFFTFAAKQATDRKTKETRQQWEMEQAKAARMQRAAAQNA